MKNLKKTALSQHEKYRGKLEISSKVPLETKEHLSIFYTPGVAAPCIEIRRDPKLSYKYTGRGNTIAVVTDGTAVLGLGDIGPLAAMPVMEGKCVLFKKFGGVNAIPICLDTKKTDEIVSIIKAIAPSFGGINLEDISAPRCFEIEKKLIHELDIPIFHDDQHGTAIVCLAGMINALKIVKKKKTTVKVIISGSGAAGIAITKLFLKYGFKNISLLDSKGLIYKGRTGLNDAKKKIAELTNKEKLNGQLKDALKNADAFIGVSKPGIATAAMIKTMKKDPIVFAMSNPDPEIMPEEAKKGGAKIIATGRSDYPNQINNVLVFPGIFKGALNGHARKINDRMKIAAAVALAGLVKNPTPDAIIPSVFMKNVSDVIAKAVTRPLKKSLTTAK